jgi:uncharacterized protein YecE (DUF72 family)
MRYASRLNGVEINSSFYRPHRIGTYQRWAESTPEGFRFAVKLPKQITHVQRLVDVQPQIDRFAAEVSGLGGKLGPILIQLPPSLAFDECRFTPCFRRLRQAFEGALVCEPRHASWFRPEADAMLREFQIARVAADPSVVAEAANPGGERTCGYFRWHGSPRMYYSNYEPIALQNLVQRMQTLMPLAKQVWCVFDNTAEGAALLNALSVWEMTGEGKFVGDSRKRLASQPASKLSTGNQPPLPAAKRE